MIVTWKGRIINTWKDFALALIDCENEYERDALFNLFKQHHSNAHSLITGNNNTILSFIPIDDRSKYHRLIIYHNNKIREG